MARSAIIKDLANSTVDTMTALKRAKVLFAELGNDNLLEWVSYEIAGYPADANLPDYRKVRGRLVGSYIKGSMASHMKWTNVSLPLGTMPDNIQEALLSVYFREGVGALRQLAESSKEDGQLGKTIAPDFFPVIATYNNDPYMYITSANVLIGPQLIQDVFSTVESRLLDALIVLEKEFGNLDELDIDISAKTSDFQPDDETGIPEVYDNQKVIVGGMITDKTIKYTKNNKVMAFLTVEDLVGTVEVVVFPRDYEKCQMFLNEDARLFIQGRVSAEDDKASKLILEKVRLFDDMPRELWLQFESREEYAKAETGLVDDLMESRGNSTVVIYLKDVKAMKKLPPAYQVHIEDSWLERMCKKYGSSNVKIVERVLKNL